MGYTQIWQQDGCGTDEQTLLNIIREFRGNGVQGMKSQQALTEYIRRLDVNQLARMYEMDTDATLQIMIDCVGAIEAFKKAVRFSGYYSPQAHAEACEKYKERAAKAQAEKDNTESRLFEALHREDKLLKQIEDLKFTIIALKAKLYDAYEAMNEPTDKNNIKGDMQPCRAKTEKTPSGSLE